jgi:hypothetical protein
MYGTFIGGSSGYLETGAAVAVDASGAAWVAGATSSTDFQGVNGFQLSPGGGIDGFLVKVAPAGNSVVFATFLGGGGFDSATAVAVDRDGRAWVAGYSSSPNFPAAQAGTNATSGLYDAFFVQVESDGRQLLQSTLFGEAAADTAQAVAVRNGAVYAAGQTASLNLPVTNGATQPRFAGLTDGMIAVSGTIGYSAGEPLGFIPIMPCRVVDTRWPNGPVGGPTLAGGVIRNFPIAAGPCGIPSSARAYSVNIGVIPSGTLDYLALWPAGQSKPDVAVITSVDGRVRSNAAIIPAGTNGEISAYATQNTTMTVIINGYFVPKTDPAALAFYPVTPCRILDTRNANGPLGGPMLSAGVSRTFWLQSNPCNVPSNAPAYSLNLVAIPPAGKPLQWLTAYPAGQPRPVVSSLIASTGTVTANAAIVPAVNGGIDMFVTDDVHATAIVNGYFAPPGPGGLFLYASTPCRVLDTRQGGAPPLQGTRNVNVIASACNVHPAARAFVLSTVATPRGAPPILQWLTMWPEGTARPVVGALNAYDGIATSNMTIVPTSNGSISLFTTDPADVTLDVFGYFAP